MTMEEIVKVMEVEGIRVGMMMTEEMMMTGSNKKRRINDLPLKSYLITKENNQDLVEEEGLYHHLKREVLMQEVELAEEQVSILEDQSLTIWLMEMYNNRKRMTSKSQRFNLNQKMKDTKI